MALSTVLTYKKTAPIGSTYKLYGATSNGLLNGAIVYNLGTASFSMEQTLDLHWQLAVLCLLPPGCWGSGPVRFVGHWPPPRTLGVAQAA